ncbi:7-cyano-7-deazaguanine synthase QueC, partial [Escherichia coli]
MNLAKPGFRRLRREEAGRDYPYALPYWL